MKVAVIGVPLDLGTDRRGTDMGPSAIRYARLQKVLIETGHEVVDRGNVSVPVAEARQAGRQNAKFIDEVVQVVSDVADEVEAACRSGELPLILGGDHSLSIGSIAGMARCIGNFGVLWIDAHGDFNTPETSPSGNIHGMPLAASAGLGAEALTSLDGRVPKVPPDRIVMVGVRELDPGEKQLIREHGIRVFTMKEVDELGIARVMREALELVSAGGLRPFHVSFDMDVIDPMFAAGVGTPVPGGLTYREAHLGMELVAEAGGLCSLELVEVNPILDTGNRTARLGVELVASALGKRIL